ncbi:MAG: glycerophosphodiester phosphodiesterase family protein [Candidatus Margulisiibacteriota bacterium]|nr:glycerophosphodiester phosphodiesterase family protein [Candidatus Margulisiibacteriota bacterium]
MNKKTFLAHRGHWYTDTIENTIPAFDKTVKLLNPKNCHGFECDLRQQDLKKPKSWVVFHDETMDRLSQKKGAIDTSSPLETNNSSGHIPTLEVFSSWLKTIKKKLIINIEIKTGSLDGITHLIEQLNSANKHQNVTFIYSSFNSDYLTHIINTTSEKIAYLINGESDLKTNGFNTINKSLNFIAIRFDKINKSIINLINKEQHKIGIYVQNKNEFDKNINKIIMLGDVIFTES